MEAIGLYTSQAEGKVAICGADVLSSLPTELWAEVYSFLSVKDKFSVAMSDPYFTAYLTLIAQVKQLASKKETIELLWGFCDDELERAIDSSGLLRGSC